MLKVILFKNGEAIPLEDVDILYKEIEISDIVYELKTNFWFKFTGTRFDMIPEDTINKKMKTQALLLKG